MPLTGVAYHAKRWKNRATSIKSSTPTLHRKGLLHPNKNLPTSLHKLIGRFFCPHDDKDLNLSNIFYKWLFPYALTVMR